MDGRKITAACYMRYSSHAQDDGFSIEAQEKAIKKYADEHGYDLQYYYCDKAKTGTNSKRPEFQKMIADSKKKLFQVCIVHKTDRYIDKIIVYRDKVEVTFKVASAIFNASFPDDKSGMLKIIIEISRTELKTLPKQRRKVPANGQFGNNYLKQYQIAIL